MPKGLFLWQSEAGKYLKFRGPLNFDLILGIFFKVAECGLNNYYIIARYWM